MLHRMLHPGGCSIEEKGEVGRMAGRAAKSGMVDAPVDVKRIRNLYDFLSAFYGPLAAPFEEKARLLGIRLARIRPGERVLEVAVGPGRSFLEILKKVGRTGKAHGVDLSPKMLSETRKFVESHGFADFELAEADARRLPFGGGTFDVLYNSYMLDLIPLGDMPRVIREFRRVLKKGGRLVLVNLSKPDASPVLYEKAYRIAPYALGGCRPVLMEGLVRKAGLKNVKRTFVGGIVPSEVVTAVK